MKLFKRCAGVSVFALGILVLAWAVSMTAAVAYLLVKVVSA
jgi:hypothetical protein